MCVCCILIWGIGFRGWMDTNSGGSRIPSKIFNYRDKQSFFSFSLFVSADSLVRFL